MNRSSRAASWAGWLTRHFRAYRALIVALLSAACAPGLAHDTPGDTRVLAIAKVEGGRLHVILRMPLGLLMNLNLPKQGPGYLVLDQLDEGLALAVQLIDRDVRWYDANALLLLSTGVARVAPPSDKSFGSFDSARSHVHGPPIPVKTLVFWNQGYVDAHLEYSLRSSSPSIGVEFLVAPSLRDRVRLNLRLILADGNERAFNVSPAEGQQLLDPRWHQAAWSFMHAGVEHILSGIDHLLFVLCLVLPFRRIDRYLVGVITAFTLAHSVTLIGSAFGMAPSGAWFVPLVELLVAATIVYMAIENVLFPQLQQRWILSASFGLVHGFAFSFALQDSLQFAGSNLLVSLLAFNVGVELGQLGVLVMLMPLLIAWRAWSTAPQKAVDIVICALIAHTAWHWAADRLTQYEALAPADGGPPVALVLSAMALLLFLLLAWRGWSKRKQGGASEAAATVRGVVE